jgi:type VI protein secretion system component VasF
LDAAKLQAMLPGRVAAGTHGLREWRKEIRREVPLWPWLLAAAALVFLTEGWVGSRLAKHREISAGGETPKWLGRRAGA